MAPGNLVWNRRDAIFGALVAAGPAIVIVTGDVAKGLQLLLGLIPAAVVGLAPRRKERRVLAIVGVLFSFSILIGSILAQWTIVAVVGMFLIGLGGAMLAAKRALGLAVLAVVVPLTGAGLNYQGVEHGAGPSALFLVSTATAFVIALCLPEFDAPPAVSPTLMSAAVARDFGIRLGLAVALSTGIGLYFGVEHTGWIVISTALVMRPGRELMELRSVGRAVSVFIGALVAAWLLLLDLPPIAIAIVGAAVVTGETAMHSSRWFVTPGFNTFLILWPVLYGQATEENVSYRFWERVLETLLGIGIAYLFALVPRPARRQATATT